MAKKFLKVTGLYKVFNVATDGKSYDLTNIKTLEIADIYSQLYITATEEDEPYGYAAGKTYIYANGTFINGNGDIIDVTELPEAGPSTTKDVYRDSDGRLWQTILSSAEEEIICTFSGNGAEITASNINFVFPSNNVAVTSVTSCFSFVPGHGSVYNGIRLHKKNNSTFTLTFDDSIKQVEVFAVPYYGWQGQYECWNFTPSDLTTVYINNGETIYNITTAFPASTDVEPTEKSVVIPLTSSHTLTFTQADATARSVITKIALIGGSYWSEIITTPTINEVYQTITDLDNSLATVAKSGLYNDLHQKPELGDIQVYDAQELPDTTKNYEKKILRIDNVLYEVAVEDGLLIPFDKATYTSITSEGDMNTAAKFNNYLYKLTNKEINEFDTHIDGFVGFSGDDYLRLGSSSQSGSMNVLADNINMQCTAVEITFSQYNKSSYAILHVICDDINNEQSKEEYFTIVPDDETIQTKTVKIEVPQMDYIRIESTNLEDPNTEETLVGRRLYINSIKLIGFTYNDEPKKYTKSWKEISGNGGLKMIDLTEDVED